MIQRGCELTLLGEQFLAAPAPPQVWLLFATWWMRTNWVIAAPFGYQNGSLPAGFTSLTLSRLLDLPVMVPTSFESFADRLIEAARLVWLAEDQEGARVTLRITIESMVVEPLVEFGVLASKYEPHTKYGIELKELATFQVTPFGKGLLEAIRASLR